MKPRRPALAAQLTCLAGGLWLTAAAAAPAAAATTSDVVAINRALAAAKPGDTIVIRNGVYRDACLTMAQSGERGKPVTLAAETPGRVFFTGDGPHASGATLTLTGQYFHVTGLVFHKSTGGTAVWFRHARFSRLSHCAFNASGETRSTFTHMIEVGEDSADNEIDHCYIAKSLSISIGTRGGAVRCHIHHNWWRDIVARSSNGQEALQLQWGRAGVAYDPEAMHTPASSLFALVENNLFDGACGDEEIISVKANDCTIRHNTFLAHPTANRGGINIRHGHRNVVEANTMLGTDYGVRVSGDDNVVINNYIERPTHGLRLTGGGTGGWAYLPCRNGLFANNAIVDANYGPVEIGVYVGMTDPKGSTNVVSIYPSGNRIVNNILTTGRPEMVVLTVSNRGVGANELANNLGFSAHAKSVSDLALPQGVLGADPRLATVDGRLTPQPGSPAVAGGVAVERVRDDIDGRPRLATPDIGCQEVSSRAPAQRHAVTAKEVGPDWMHGDFTALEQEALVVEMQEAIKAHPDPKFRQRLREAVEAPPR